ncbi:MAG: glutamate synthase subunit beta [Saprospiraceae bacterium]
MGNPKGFLEHTRELPAARPVEERLKDYREIPAAFPLEKTVEQASRCMDCGVPFCHNSCPLGNVIPEFNDAVYQQNWEEAAGILLHTNPFPEFTGRICPAPCEAACVLGINQPPVTIEHLEKTIAEVAFEKGIIRSNPPNHRSGKKVAVVGSGPAGLATAAELNQAGHSVTVFERAGRVGGLLRYGIPDFKLEKWVVDRRVSLMKEEGIRFVTGANVGVNVDPHDLMKKFDALVLCGGATVPRDLLIPGRQLKGVHFAMEFLEKNNRMLAGDTLQPDEQISAAGKHVVVIGGGDTGSDCVGTANRHGALSVTQIELLAKPPAQRDESTPWPLWPVMVRTSTSHEEGCHREWAVLTKEFTGDNDGNLKALRLVSIRWGDGKFEEIPGTEREIPCDLALLSIGFLHPQFEGLLEQLGVEINDRGNVRDEHYRTNVEKVFVAGDMRRGQSLVVWAIQEGRDAARAVNDFLQVGR